MTFKCQALSITSDNEYNVSFDLPLDVNSDSALINDLFLDLLKNLVFLIQKLHCNELMGYSVLVMIKTVCLTNVQQYWILINTFQSILMFLLSW